MAGSTFPEEGVILIEFTLPRCGMINSSAELSRETEWFFTALTSIGVDFERLRQVDVWSTLKQGMQVQRKGVDISTER